MIVDKMKKREPTAKKIKNKVDIPVGKWIKCDKCQEILYKEDVRKIIVFVQIAEHISECILIKG